MYQVSLPLLAGSLTCCCCCDYFKVICIPEYRHQLQHTQTLTKDRTQGRGLSPRPAAPLTGAQWCNTCNQEFSAAQTTEMMQQNWFQNWWFTNLNLGNYYKTSLLIDCSHAWIWYPIWHFVHFSSSQSHGLALASLPGAVCIIVISDPDWSLVASVSPGCVGLRTDASCVSRVRPSLPSARISCGFHRDWRLSCNTEITQPGPSRRWNPRLASGEETPARPGLCVQAVMVKAGLVMGQLYPTSLPAPAALQRRLG